jgi:hypothetical protein
MDSASLRGPRSPQEGRSLFALFSDLWRETSTLVHEEVELAKAEVSEKVSEIGTGAKELAIGGLIVFAGFIVTLLALSNGLAHLLPEEVADWLAPLIVGVVVMVCGAAALLRGRRHMQPENLSLERTTESMRRNAQMAKGHVS